MYVLLKGEIDRMAAIVDPRILRDLADLLRSHPRHKIGLDLRVTKVEKVAREIPHKPLFLDGPTVSTKLVERLDNKVILVDQPVREAQAADSSADDQVFHVVQRLPTLSLTH